MILATVHRRPSHTQEKSISKLNKHQTHKSDRCNNMNEWFIQDSASVTVRRFLLISFSFFVVHSFSLLTFENVCVNVTTKMFTFNGLDYIVDSQQPTKSGKHHAYSYSSHCQCCTDYFMYERPFSINVGLRWGYIHFP